MSSFHSTACTISKKPTHRCNCYVTTIGAKTEIKAYKPFVSSLCTLVLLYLLYHVDHDNPAVHQRPEANYSSKFVDGNKHTSFPFKIKPDVSVYDTESLLQSPTNSTLVEIFIKFKWSNHDNPFELQDWNNPFVRRTKRSIDMLGQITAYATAQFGSQFWTHIYSILIVKSKPESFDGINLVQLSLKLSNITVAICSLSSFIATQLCPAGCMVLMNLCQC